MVTKKELLTGVIRFIRSEVIPGISDKALKMVLTAGLYAVDSKPVIVDPFLSNPIVSAILQGENGMYDVDTTIGILKKLANEYGGIPVTIPPIKFVTGAETTLTFHEADISKLKYYITGSEQEESNA